jgi:hypothetical protein
LQPADHRVAVGLRVSGPEPKTPVPYRPPWTQATLRRNSAGRGISTGFGAQAGSLDGSAAQQRMVFPQSQHEQHHLGPLAADGPALPLLTRHIPPSLTSEGISAISAKSESVRIP